MFLFIAEKIDGNQAFVSGDEALHAIRVLRMRTGDMVKTTSLDGTMHEAVIRCMDKDSFVAEIVKSTPFWGKRNYNLRICIAPTKNIDRYEWFLEKAVEIGIDRVTPICCDHSERKQVKSDRGLKIIRSAVKQSMKASMPMLDEMMEFSRLLKEDLSAGERYIAHCDQGTKSDIRDVMKKNGNYTILIGPEGDFSKEEILSATDAGFCPVSFGESRLRTETAALWATSLASILNR